MRGKEREGLGGSRRAWCVVVSVPQRVTWRWSQSGGRVDDIVAGPLSHVQAGACYNQLTTQSTAARSLNDCIVC
jgi:hypothetical protein